MPALVRDLLMETPHRFAGPYVLPLGDVIFLLGLAPLITVSLRGYGADINSPPYHPEGGGSAMVLVPV